MGISCQLLTPKANANRQNKGQARARLIRLLLKIKKLISGIVTPSHYLRMGKPSVCEPGSQIHSQRKGLVCQTWFFEGCFQLKTNPALDPLPVIAFASPAHWEGLVYMACIVLPQGPHTQGRKERIPAPRRLGRGMRRMFQEDDDESKDLGGGKE